MIDDSGFTVYVNYGECVNIIKRIIDKGSVPKLMRKLNQYGVTVKDRDFKSLRQIGALKEELDGIYFIVDRSQYDEKVGLRLDNHWLEEILIK